MRARPRSAGGAEDPGPVKTAPQLAGETTAYERSDFVFVGSMEGGVERGLPAFTEFMSAMRDAGSTAETHPLVQAVLAKFPKAKITEIRTQQEIAAEVQRLTEAAREGRVAASDLKGGTISISNIGALGGTYAAPIINIPFTSGISQPLHDHT